MSTEAPGRPTTPPEAEAGGKRTTFRSDRGRPEVNPYVERIRELEPWVVAAEDSAARRGGWREEAGFPSDAPLFLEIGPGNGFFFRELARRRPDALLIGVEIRFKRVWLTARKAVDAGLRNFRVVHHHVGWLDTMFADGELDAIHLNHPDPWPKDRQQKHRLIRPDFAELLARLLRPGGLMHVKSDFAPYGPLAREVFAPPTWELEAFTADLHGEGGPLLEQNIETNYERKKIAAGERILVARFRRAG